MKIIRKLQFFFKEKIWVENDAKKGFSKFLNKVFRVFYISFVEFKKNSIHTHVTSLTLYSLLSVVPFVAIAFAVMKGFRLENILEKTLTENFSGQEEVLNYIIKFSSNLLNTTKGGLVALISLFFLIYVVIRLIKQIDKSFNIIWKVQSPRNWKRRIADYLAILFGAILILLITSSLNVFTKTIQSESSTYKFIEYLTPALLFLLKLLPYLLLWSLFVFLYLFLPKEKIKFKSAFFSAIFAGSLYQLSQWSFVTLQIGVGRNNAIYGSFAALPLFILWLQISWLIILFSAEVSFAIQNINKYKHVLTNNSISQNQKKWIAILILKEILAFFKNNDKKLSITEIAEKIKIDDDIVNEVCLVLFKVNLVEKVENNDDNNDYYTPSMTIKNYTYKEIFSRLDNYNYNSNITDVSLNLEYDDFITKINSNKDLNSSILY